MDGVDVDLRLDGVARLVLVLLVVSDSMEDEDVVEELEIVEVVRAMLVLKLERAGWDNNGT